MKLGETEMENVLEKEQVSLGDTEWEVKSIWEEVLQRKGIGPNDDFFDIGGTSLALIRVLGRINQHFGTSLPVDVFAQEATIASLAKSVAAARQQ